MGKKLKVAHVYKKHYDVGDGITNVVQNLFHYQSTGNNRYQFIDMPFSFDNKIKAKGEYGYVGFFGMLIRFLRQKPDIIYLHGFFYIHFLILGGICLFFKTKFIFIPHCSLLESAMAYKPIRKNVYFSVFSWLYQRKIALVQFLNEEEMNGSRVFYFSPKYVIIPNGVNTPDSRCQSFEHLSMFYLGRCDVNHKGLDILLQYMKDDNIKFPLNIFGANSEEHQLLKKIIDGYNIADKISIFKPAFDKEKISIFNSHNVFILLSRYEGLPISVLEALSYGCICLLSSPTNMSNEVVDHHCGFKVDSLDDFIKAIGCIQKMNEDDLNKMSLNAKQLVKDKYSWHRISNDTLCHLDKLNDLVEK